MLVCGGAGAGVAAVVGPAHAWVTDGDVLAIASAGGSTYVGGDFRLIGRSTGSWAEVDSAGAVGAIRAVVRGSVADAVADGRGGWFLRGDISAVGGVDVGKTEVVHLRANGRLDADWSIRTDGEIHAMARAGDRLYVGGSFTRTRRACRGNLACDPCPLRSAARLGPQGRRTDEERRGRGCTRSRRRPTGACSSSGATSAASTARCGGRWPRSEPTALYVPSTPVRATRTLARTTKDEEELSASVSLVALDPRGRALYVAGDFEMLGGAERPGLGAVDARTGRVRPWNPDCDGDVWAIDVAPAGSPVYVAGEFASIGGKSRRGLAAVDAGLGRRRSGTPESAGQSTPSRWTPGGRSSSPAANSSRSETSTEPTSPPWTRAPASATPWDVPVVGTVDVVGAPRAGGVAVGGDFESVGALRRDGPRGADGRRLRRHGLAAADPRRRPGARADARHGRRVRRRAVRPR